MCQGSQGSSMGPMGYGRSSMPSGPYSQAPQQNFYNPRAGGASPQWNPMQGGMQKPYQPPMSSPNNYQSPPFVPPGTNTQGYNPAKDANPADPVFQAMGYQNASGAGYTPPWANEPAYQHYGPDQHQPGRIPNTSSFSRPRDPPIEWLPGQQPPGPPPNPEKPPMSSPNYQTPPIFNQDIYGQAKPGVQPRGYQSPPWNPYMYQGK